MLDSGPFNVFDKLLLFSLIFGIEDGIVSKQFIIHGHDLLQIS